MDGKFLSLVEIVINIQENIFFEVHREAWKNVFILLRLHLCEPAATAVVNGHWRASPVMRMSHPVSQLSGADHLSLPNPAEHITHVYMHADDVTHFPQSSATSSWIFGCSQTKAVRMAPLYLEQDTTVMC